MPDFAIVERLITAPVVLESVTPLQVAEYEAMVALFFAVAVPGVTYKYEYPWINTWSLLVTVAVVEPSFKVIFPNPDTFALESLALPSILAIVASAGMLTL